MASIVGTQQDATNNSLVNLPTGDYFPFFLDHLAHFSSRPILTPVFRSVIPFNWRIQPWIQMNLKEGEKRLEQCMQIVIGLVNRYSRRTSVLINRLPYNDSSREQHNNEIYAGEIYGVITMREKREGGREKNGWHISRLDEELRCLFARFSAPLFSRFVAFLLFPARAISLSNHETRG